MRSETMVFGATLRRSEKWRVFRIRTANSTYELELQSASDPQARRCAVLTKAGSSESFTDASPLAGSESLYAVNPMDWIGRRLTIGTAQISEVQSVDFVGTTEQPKRRTMTFVAPKAAPAQSEPRPEPRPRAWAPFPLSHVEMAETAAMLLKALVHRADLFSALKGDELAERRMTLSLAECRLMLEALHRRG